MPGPNSHCKTGLDISPCENQHASTFAIARSNSPAALAPLLKLAKRLKGIGDCESHGDRGEWALRLH